MFEQDDAADQWMSGGDPLMGLLRADYRDELQKYTNEGRHQSGRITVKSTYEETQHWSPYLKTGNLQLIPANLYVSDIEILIPLVLFYNLSQN